MDTKLNAIINDLNWAKILSDLADGTHESLNMLAFLGLDRAIELGMKIWVENDTQQKQSNISFYRLMKKTPLDPDQSTGKKLNEHHNQYRNFNKHDTESLIKQPRGEFIETYYDAILAGFEELFKISREAIQESYNALKPSIEKFLKSMKPTPNETTDLYENQLSDFLNYSNKLASKIQKRGYWVISISPKHPLDEEISFGDLQRIVEESRINSPNWQYPELQLGTIEPYINYIEGSHEHKEYNQIWRFYQNGHFLYMIGLLEDWKSDWLEEFWSGKPPDLNIPDTLNILNLSYLFASKLFDTIFKELQIDDQIVIHIDLRNIGGKKVGGLDRSKISRRFHMTQCKLGFLPYNKEVTIPKLQENYGDYALSNLRFILERFNVLNPDMSVFEELQRKLQILK